MTQLTAELLVDRLEPSDLQVSPDGRLVAFVVAPVGRAGEHKESAIWVVPVDGSEPARTLTAGTAQDHKPRWAPDSRSLYFLSDRAERKQAQVHRLPIDGGEALPLTSGKPGIETFAPLPDGRTVALLSSDRPSEEHERREKERDDPQVFGEQWRPHRLRLLDVDSRAVTTLLATGDLHVANLAPSPDGSLIAVVLWETPDYDHIARPCTLAVVDPVADRLRARWTIPAGEVDLAWSSAGGELVVLGPSGSGGQVGNGLFLVGLEDGEPRPLPLDRPSCPLWLAPAGAPLVSVAEGLDSWVGRVEGEAVVPVGPVMPGSLHYLSTSPDGGVIAGLRGGPGEPYDVWAGPADGELRRVSDLKPELRRVAWGAQERLTWRASDGLELDGVLVLPAGKTREDGPFPMVTLVHGGPYWRTADDLQLSWAQPAEWLALDGYASFLPNPRGGLGHGSAFAELVQGAVGIDDWSDIVAGLDALIGQGVADPGRLAIGGWSQGGYMSAWAVTQTDRFRAAVMGAGVSDWGMMVAESDLPTFEASLGGSTGWEGPGPHRHDELSPVSFAHRAKTPTLILHGEKDERVPLGQARFFARALEAAGVPFELVLYPREPHGLEERNHLLDLLRRWREWLARWLEG
jgi:dipeptidyl aminopeptidase/acylaminoacyl peptidase